MNVVGIIAEYNPMHNGHIYNIKKAKELTNADYVIVIMSGSFTQQGNIAVMDKFNRASIAIQNGADMVIELPTIYAVSSAENFAYGAVSILSSLGVITHLAFGAESENICDLQGIANAYINNKDEIVNKVKAFSNLGINSGSAYSKALSEILNCNISTKCYTLPNNILAIEYLKVLLTLKSQIKPVLVHRLNSYHNDKKIPNSSGYASSTSIRNILSNNSLSLDEMLVKIDDVVPKNTWYYLKNNSFHINENLWNNLKYEILKLNTEGLKNIHEVTEGLENKLYKQALKCNNYEEYLFAVKSKRYTLSKIKRICVYILLGITKEKYNKLKSVNYARILKVSKKSLELLSKISNSATNFVITKVSDNILSNLETDISESIKLDIISHNLFFSCNMDYTNKIIQP